MTATIRLLVLCVVAAASPRLFASYEVFGSGDAASLQVLLSQEQAAPAPVDGSPIPWRAEIAASVRAPFGRLLVALIRITPRLIGAALTLLVFWAVATAVRRLTHSVVRVVPDQTLRRLLVQLAYYAVWAIGAVVALDSLGVDAQAVVTGLGLTSIALGFALRDILSNLVSGLLIMVSRSFEIGDQIIVGETEGTVEQIEMRVTHIRTYDGRLVLVPNAEVFTSRVVNNTASPQRRASIIVPIDSRQDLQLACQTIDEAMRGTAGVAADPPPLVRLRDLVPGWFAVEARFWTDAHRSDFMNTSCNVRAAIVHALKERGVEMQNPDTRGIAPGDDDRWRAVVAGKMDAGRS